MEFSLIFCTLLLFMSTTSICLTIYLWITLKTERRRKEVNKHGEPRSDTCHRADDNHVQKIVGNQRVSNQRKLKEHQRQLIQWNLKEKQRLEEQRKLEEKQRQEKQRKREENRKLEEEKRRAKQQKLEEKRERHEQEMRRQEEKSRQKEQRKKEEVRKQNEILLKLEAERREKEKLQQEFELKRQEKFRHIFNERPRPYHEENDFLRVHDSQNNEKTEALLKIGGGVLACAGLLLSAKIRAIATVGTLTYQAYTAYKAMDERQKAPSSNARYYS